MAELSSFLLLGMWRPPNVILSERLHIQIHDDSVSPKPFPSPPSSAISGSSVKVGPAAPLPWQRALVLLTERMILWLSLPSPAWRGIDLTHATVAQDKSHPDVFEVHTSLITLRFRAPAPQSATQWADMIRVLVEVHTDTGLLETAEHMFVDRMESRYQGPFAAAMSAMDASLPKGYRPGTKLNLRQVALPVEQDVREGILELSTVLPTPALVGSPPLSRAASLPPFTPLSPLPEGSGSMASPKTDTGPTLRLSSFLRDGRNPEWSIPHASPPMSPSNWSTPIDSPPVHYPFAPSFSSPSNIPILSSTGPLAGALIQARRESQVPSTAHPANHFVSILHAAAVAGCHELFIVARYMILAGQIQGALATLTSTIGPPKMIRQTTSRHGAAHGADQRHRATIHRVREGAGHRGSGSTASSLAGGKSSQLSSKWEGTPHRASRDASTRRRSNASSASSVSEKMSGAPTPSRTVQKSNPTAIRYGFSTSVQLSSKFAGTFEKQKPDVMSRRSSAGEPEPALPSVVSAPLASPDAFTPDFAAKTIQGRAGRLSADDTTLVALTMEPALSPPDHPAGQMFRSGELEASMLSTALAVPNIIKTGVAAMNDLLESASSCAGPRQ